MYHIYLVTNLVNNKVYVGQTSRSIRERWREHLKCSRNPRIYFYRALHKYGQTSFSVHELAVVPTVEQANNLEKLWIIALRSFDRQFGYNGTLGGINEPNAEILKKKFDNGSYRDDVDDAEICRLYEAELLSTRQIARRFNCSPTTIKERLKNNEIVFRPRTCFRKRNVTNQHIVDLYKEGLSSTKIAMHFGISQSAVCYRLRLAGVKARERK